jgi:hypothetical protein
MSNIEHVFDELEKHKAALSELEDAAGVYGYLQVPQTLVVKMEREMLAIAQLERELVLRGHLQVPDNIRIKPLNQPPLTDSASSSTFTPNSRELPSQFLTFVVILLVLLIALLMALLLLLH